MPIPEASTTYWHSAEFKRRQTLVYDAVRVHPLPSNQIALDFDYSEKLGHYLRIEWRTGLERRSTKEELDSYRVICVAIAANLSKSLREEIESISIKDVVIFDWELGSEVRPSTYPRNARLPIKFKKDA